MTDLFLMNYTSDDDFAVYVDDRGDCTTVMEYAEPRGSIYATLDKALDMGLAALEEEATERGEYVSLQAELRTRSIPPECRQSDEHFYYTVINAETKETFGAIVIWKMTLIK